MTVSSGLAFVPQWLRFHLRGSGVRGDGTHSAIGADRIDGSALGHGSERDAAGRVEVRSIVKNSLEADEICEKRVKPLRFAKATGTYDKCSRNE